MIKISNVRILQNFLISYVKFLQSSLYDSKKSIIFHLVKDSKVAAQLRLAKFPSYGQGSDSQAGNLYQMNHLS